MGSLLNELKRRKVFRVAAVYAVVSWVVIQIADTLFPALQLPEWTITLVTVLLILGFFPTMVMAWAYQRSEQGIQPDHLVQPSAGSVATSAQPINYLILVVVLVMAGVQVFDRAGSESGDEPTQTTTVVNNTAPVTRLSIAMPPDQNFSMSRGDFDISPDGTFFVYRAPIEGGDGLWLRRFNSLEATPLSGTLRATRPRISPDGTEVAFSAGGRIRVVPLAGGLSRTLAEENSPDTPRWSADGEYLYFKDGSDGISRIPAQGGSIEEIVRTDTEAGERDLVFPEALPDTDKLLFEARTADTDTIYAFDMQSGERKALVQGKYPVYSRSGHLLFQAVDAPILYAVKINVDSLELIGEPVPIADSLFQVGTGGSASIALSDTGRLLYRGYGDTTPGYVPMLIERDGTETELESGWSMDGDLGIWGLALSPTGDRLAINMNRGSENSDIWIKDLNRGPFSRMTFSRDNVRPSWTPDGQELLFISTREDGRRSIWSRRADGGGVATELLVSDRYDNINNVDVSPDGRYLIFRANDEGEQVGNMYYVETSGERVQRPLVEDEFRTWPGSLSPDGRWLAYSSDETGNREVYVIPFPPAEDSGRWMVSLDGGTTPIWSRDGSELYYRNGLREIVATQINPGDNFSWGEQQTLFSMEGYAFAGPSRSYDVTTDGKFIAIKIRSNAQFIMVDNWMAELPQ